MEGIAFIGDDRGTDKQPRHIQFHIIHPQVVKKKSLSSGPTLL